MATNLELQANQKNKLFMLLTLKEKNKGKHFEALDGFIFQTKAEMTQEDVAWVEKIVREQLQED